MIVETVPVMGDNYAYLVACEKTRQAAAVDPAGAEAVRQRLAELDLQLCAVWTTHHHGDHTMGNVALAQAFEGVRVYGHESERDRIPALTDAVTHGATLQLGELQAEVLHTPGHTRGSVCYRVGDALFSGDTLFAAGCGRLFEGDPPTMLQSLHQVIGALPHQTQVYCGHEYTEKNLDFAWSVEPDNPALQARIDAVSALRARGEPSVPFTLAAERASSPFFRCQSSEIQATLARRFPDDPPQTPLEVFTRLRELRNAF